MVKTIAIAVAAALVLAVAGVLIVAATRPDSFRVQRAATIQAPPEKIYALLQDLRGWSTWSPYEAKDPAMKRTFGNPSAGVGATYAWQGNKEVGEGRMEILQATPPSRVVIKLDFIEPFEGHNTAEFVVAPKGAASEVTWAIYGPSPFVTKVMGVVFDMDAMIGKDFEVGLANLKALAER